MLPKNVFEIEGKLYNKDKGVLREGGVMPSADCVNMPCENYTRMEASLFTPIRLRIPTIYNWLVVKGYRITLYNNKPPRIKVGECYIGYSVYDINTEIDNVVMQLILEDVTDYGTLYKIVRNRKKEVIGFIRQDNTKN